MRQIRVKPLRRVVRELLLPTGDVVAVLECRHELRNALLDEDGRVPCRYCIGGIETVIPIEQVPVNL